MENMGILTGNQLLPLTLPLTFRANYHLHNVVSPLKTRRKSRKALKLLAKLDDSSSPTNSQQQVNLSVLRFTFG